MQAGRFAEAEKRAVEFRRETREPSVTAELLYMLAVARRRQRNFEGALQVLNELLAMRPEHARAYQERGYNHLSLNQLDHATAAFARAVEFNPGLVASWRALAELYQRDGEARKAHFARTQKDYLESLPEELAGVVDLTHEGQLYKAETLCRSFLVANKHHVEGMRLLADIAMRLKIYDDAEFLLESCVELAPDNLRARSDYLRTLNRKCRFDKALEQAEKLVAMQPNNPAFRLARANALAGLGRYQEAIAAYTKCLGKTGNKPGEHVMLGHAYKAVGDLEAAVERYKAAAQLDLSYGDAWWSLANTKTYRFSDDEIQRMRTVEKDEHLPLEDRIHLCFAVGKALEDQASFEDSFAYYERGNELKHRQTGYEPQFISNMIDEQVETCSTDLFAKLENAGCKAPDPIFIVGLPRAGSTLLEQVLASHSMVDGTMELHNILGLAQRLRGRAAQERSKYPGILRELDPDYFRRFGEKFIEATRVYRGDAPFFIDKMPNNFMHIGLIRLILPNAKVIDARRHPLACCFSGFKQLFGEGQDFSYSLESIGKYYRDYVRLMDHWDVALPEMVLRVHYEKVVEDLEGQVRRLLDFCGLPFEESCLEFHKTKRHVRTPSSEQVRQPIYRSGLEYWRNYEPWLGPLKEALGTELRHRYDIQH